MLLLLLELCLWHSYSKETDFLNINANKCIHPFQWLALIFIMLLKSLTSNISSLPSIDISISLSLNQSKVSQHIEIEIGILACAPSAWACAAMLTGRYHIRSKISGGSGKISSTQSAIAPNANGISYFAVLSA